MKTLSKILLAVKPRTIAVVIGLALAIFGTTSESSHADRREAKFSCRTAAMSSPHLWAPAQCSTICFCSPRRTVWVPFSKVMSLLLHHGRLGHIQRWYRTHFRTNSQNARIFFTGPASRNLDNVASRDCGLSVGAGPNFREI